MPNDATCFFVKHEEETFGAVERRVGGLFHKHKLVMAFTEAMVRSQEKSFRFRSLTLLDFAPSSRSLKLQTQKLKAEKKEHERTESLTPSA